jgi:hypothetical protein
MSSRSHPTDFAEAGPWLDPILKSGAMGCENHRPRALQFFRSAVAVLAALSIFGGLALSALAL